jgi:two-component system sensor histidine kinase TctE
LSAVRTDSGLRRDLTLRLMLPLLGIVAAAGLIGVATAQRLVDQVFDRWLLDSAHALAAQVRQPEGAASVELAPSAAAILAFDEVDETFFNATQGQRLLVGHPGLPDRGTRQAVYPAGRAFDAVVDGREARVAAIEVCPACTLPTTVRVTETTTKRGHVRLEILAMLMPLVLLLAGAAVTIAFALQRTIAPLERIAQGWTELSHLSLRPIATDGVPRELRPFATALNDLLARIRAMLARERQFALTAAHQLRTPLTGLQLGLARAADAPTLEEARAVISGLHASTQRTARLIQQLLLLGRLDPEVRGELAFERADLTALAHDVGSAYLDLATSRSIDLSIVAPPAPVQAIVHAELIGEALGNLLDNALRHAPAGGQVVIGVEADPPSLSVADSGPGMDPARQGKLFERFVRGQAGADGGSGLGLSIVRDIAVLHGAEIEVAGATLGGALVTLRFVAAPLP